jgi:hypothetical protein
MQVGRSEKTAEWALVVLKGAGWLFMIPVVICVAATHDDVITLCFGVYNISNG